MTESSAAPSSPELSPAFDKARRLSRALVILFTIGFWFMVAWLAVLPLLVVWPDHGGLSLGGKVPLTDMSLGARASLVLIVIAATVPSLMGLYHARRLFRSFAAGQVFVAAAIADIRITAFWLIVIPFANAAHDLLANMIIPHRPAHTAIQGALVIVGIATYVAAHVMAEARRIADDNASIV